MEKYNITVMYHDNMIIIELDYNHNVADLKLKIANNSEWKLLSKNSIIHHNFFKPDWLQLEHVNYDGYLPDNINIGKLEAFEHLILHDTTPCIDDIVDEILEGKILDIDINDTELEKEVDRILCLDTPKVELPESTIPEKDIPESTILEIETDIPESEIPCLEDIACSPLSDYTPPLLFSIEEDIKEEIVEEITEEIEELDESEEIKELIDLSSQYEPPLIIENYNIVEMTDLKRDINIIKKKLSSVATSPNCIIS